ncbi:MAG: hypothetical protein KatS3mg010_0358 [Acidimicrobiia bacterium]|nr:MAG: hypothetical protein KatS3mg010_0358 [Acidimicrobiia bacterium]
MSGTNTFGENVTAVAERRIASARRRGHQLVERQVQQVPHTRTLPGRCGVPAHQPQHPAGLDARSGKVDTPFDPLQRVALLRARDGDDREAAAGDRGEREGESRMAVRAVAGRHDEAVTLVERG